MDFLKAEIEKRQRAKEGLRKEAQERQRSAPGKRSRYVRRGDLQACEDERKRKEEEEARSLKRQRKGATAGQASGETKEALDAMSPASRRAKLNELGASKAQAAAAAHEGDGDRGGRRAEGSEEEEEEAVRESELQPEDVVLRLRELGEPVTLFGESTEERYERLKRVVNETEKDAKGDTALGGGYEIGNVMVPGDDGDEEGEREETDIAALQSKIKDVKAEQSPEMVVYRFFKNCLHEWAIDLAQRTPDEKRSIKGKIATRAHKQTKDYMRPFFRLCRRKTVPTDVLERAAKMVQHCMEREYVRAHDEYVLLAIGNSPWPIGVTSVGVHARTGREKISSKNIAHVMNDEAQRKYVTSFKRLMTFCQNKYPTDPSKMCM